MASLDFAATMTPADIVAGLSLDEGTRYFCQNVSTLATLFWREQAAAPAAGVRGHRVEAGGDLNIEPSGSAIWAWTDGCRRLPRDSH